MWEFSIEAKQKNSHLIDYISERIENALSSVQGVKSVVSLGDKTCIAIGCDDVFAKQLEGVLRVVICDTICEKMKFDFLKNNIDLTLSNEKLFDAFVKVYTYFDCDLERKIIVRNLVLKDKLVLESFLEFRLQPLKMKWKEMCNLTNSSSNVFLKSETFVELLKFLISNLDIKCKCLVIDFNDGCKFYEEDGNSLVALVNFEENDEMGIITQVIELCPAKLKIICGKDNQIVSTLAELFDKRVEIVK